MAHSIPLRSRRAERAERLLPLRDAVAAVALLAAAVPRFRSGEPGEVALAAVDTVVALGLIAAVVRENTRRSGHEHSRVAWIDVAAGLMLLVEAYHQRHEGRPGRMLPYATAFLALLTLAKGLYHERLAARRARRRMLTLDGDGMRFVWSRLHRVHVPRAEIASLAASERAIVVTGPSGARRTVSLRDAVEPASVVVAIARWAAEEGIPIETASGSAVRGAPADPSRGHAFGDSAR